MANGLTVVAKLSAKPGKGDELAAILREQVAAVLKAEPARTRPSISIGRRPTSRPSASAATRSSPARRRSSSTSR